MRSLARTAATAAASTTTPTSSATPGEAAAMFRGRAMAGSAYMALPITCFISLEMLKRLRPTLRHRTSVSMMRIVSVVNMAVEAGGTMEPRAGPEEHPA